MNAPFVPARVIVRLADPGDRAAIARFLGGHPDSTAFHRTEWLDAVERSTGHRSHILLSEQDSAIRAVLPLHEAHSPLFGRALVSTGFAVDGGIVGEGDPALFRAAQELAVRLNCPSLELRGGPLPFGEGWHVKSDSHAGFVKPLSADDDAQLLAIPRKQRAEVRRGLGHNMEVRTGSDAATRAMHYAVYAESVRNLGTPVFPKALFDAVMDAFGDDADILTVLHEGQPLASVLSLYHRGAVMPYWGGGVFAARTMRANDVMYFALMNHARGRGCDRFDFGRSKTDTGAYHFKRNWGFEPQPLSYASWTADGVPPRDVNPLSPRYKAKIALWQKLPLGIANRLGPLIANGLA
ncbi:FemAB family XrtA/PEP-CTERM system-associated protein [Novosphingobium sp. MMS21-SN21R]|uniref:FemAB family XrtA/PEP-CTERM system-associated protein n=1 Tax=Novosphingobium sp. MMS21-SN21R TaxID=2969298 RepID=UPI0028888EED|nr:FemAB family XrtA/PEP-CTERM system-associated protein [Novosphingobium sp. MMS21-SN21R]MDT0507749.1 FemAB family PEP-CTERM system-associated protein [Novosphingobium sp. MMS21-SN21R]